jgi:GNAT superfamily N-acetyltransferase
MKTDELDIREINAADFFRLYGGTSRLADYYARNLKNTDGILSAFSGGRALGYIIYRANPELCVTVACIFVPEAYRRKGIAGKLLLATEALFGNGAAIQISITEKIEGFSYLHKFFVKSGYGITDKMYLFRSGKSDLARWDNYMEKHGNRLVRWLTEAEGYRAVSLSDACEDIINAVRESETRSKEHYLITPFLDGAHNDFVPSMSYLALRHGSSLPAAHCMVTSPDPGSAVFSQVFAAEHERLRGAMFLPLIMSIQRCKECNYTRSVYAVNEKNTAMMAFANKVLSKITSHKTAQYNFVKKVRGL